MHRPTPSPPRSSSASARAIALEPRVSRALVAAWLALHVVLVLALAATAVPAWTKPLGWIALALHALARRPAAPRPLVWRADGTVVIEAQAYEIDRATAYTRSWVRLRLRGPAGRREVVLVRDQLPPADWSRLAARLSRGPPQRRAPSR